MLSVYDLYDLHAVFVNFRQFPDYKLNEAVLLNVIDVINDRQNTIQLNQFRSSLSNIPSLSEEELYEFVFHNNVYTYIPTILKDDYALKVLIESCICLLSAVKEKNRDKIIDLSDCLHNLPIYIAENNYTIPKKFWRREVRYYRKRWDNKFLIHLI
jgi:hypothetical protein